MPCKPKRGVGHTPTLKLIPTENIAPLMLAETAMREYEIVSGLVSFYLGFNLALTFNGIDFVTW